MEKTYTFYFNTWYVNWGVEEEVSFDDIGIEEWMDSDLVEELLKQYYHEWLWNFDTWWYLNE